MSCYTQALRRKCSEYGDEIVCHINHQFFYWTVSGSDNTLLDKTAFY